MATTLPKFWLISVPQTNGALQQQANAVAQHGRVFQLNIPPLRCGTLDDLMALSDELEKIQGAVEGTCKKIGSTLFKLVEEQQKGISMRQVLMVGNALLDDYVKEFQWDEVKYSFNKMSCKDLVSSICGDCAEFDETFRKQFSQFLEVEQSIQAQEKKQGGTLMMRDLASLVRPTDIVQSEYLATLLVVVPKFSQQDWMNQYETLMPVPDFPQPPPIVPRSTRLLAEDNEFCLFSVVVLRLVESEFKQAARSKRFIVRDFDMNENAESTQRTLRNLHREREEMRSDLIVWCRSTFSDAFGAWVHIKVIRLFIEAVLRYGLPAKFCNTVVLPAKESSEKPLRQILDELYAKLGSKMMQGSSDDKDQLEFAGMGAEVFPYVYIDLDLTMRDK